MRLAIMSDLHLEFPRATAPFDLVPSDADVLVLAGDICSARTTGAVDKALAAARKACLNVVYVAGNHEYYGTDPDTAHANIAQVAKNRGVTFLNNSSAKIAGRTFHGGTGWYRNAPGNDLYKYHMNDIHQIVGFEHKLWCYTQQLALEDWLTNFLQAGDIVVSHHLPSYQSVAAKYENSQLNRFFVCEYDQLIKDRKPTLWIHGHTHEANDYVLGATRVVCNPQGYPHEKPRDYAPLIVDV